jgi:hypothetical protein
MRYWDLLSAQVGIPHAIRSSAKAVIFQALRRTCSGLPLDY